MSKIHLLLVVFNITLSDVVHYHFDNENSFQNDNNHDWFFNMSFVLHNGMKVVLEANKKFLNDKLVFTPEKFVWTVVSPNASNIGFKTPSNQFLAVVGG